MRLRAARFALIAGSALALAGCGGGGSSAGDDGTVTLTFLSHYGEEPLEGGITKLIDEGSGRSCTPTTGRTPRASSPTSTYRSPTARSGAGRAAIQKQAFARGEIYGFRYIDYYVANMTAKGCLAGTERACAFARGGGNRKELAGP